MLNKFFLWLEKTEVKKFFLVSFLIMSLATLLAYSNSFFCSFQFDDHDFIVNNTAIRSLFNLKQILTLNERPLTNYTLAINYALGKLDPFGYHLLNFLFHIFCSSLVMLFVYILIKINGTLGQEPLRIRWLSFFSALIFALHPTKVEAVTYITARSEILGSIFYLGSLLFFLLSFLHPKKSKSLQGVSIFSAILGMLSKPIAVTLPLTALLMDYFFISKFEYLELKKRKKFYLQLFLSALLVPVLSVAFVRKAALGFANPELPSPYIYLLTELRVFLHYFKLLLFPWPGWLNIDTYFPLSKGFFELKTFVSFLIILAIIVFAFKMRKKNVFISFFIFWFFIILIPTSSFMPIEDVLFERRLYLPSLGFIFIALWLGQKIDLKKITAFILILVVLFSFWTFQRNKAWKTQFTLWNDALKKSPHKPRTHINLGFLYLKAQDLQRAEDHFKKAIELDPNSANAHLNLGLVYLLKKDYDSALKEYELALKIRPDYPAAYSGLGTVYRKKGELEKAEKNYRKAIELEPKFAEAYANLAIVLGQKNQTQEAIELLKKSISLNPEIPEAYFNLGLLYRQIKDFTLSLNCFQKAVQLNPYYLEARFYLGISFLENRLPNRAKKEYEILLKHNFNLAYKLLEYINLYSNKNK